MGLSQGTPHDVIVIVTFKVKGDGQVYLLFLGPPLGSHSNHCGEMNIIYFAMINMKLMNYVSCSLYMAVPCTCKL